MIAYAGEDAEYPALLVGMQTLQQTTLENSMMASHKIRNQLISEPSNTTLGYKPKGCLIILQGNLLI